MAPTTASQAQNTQYEIPYSATDVKIHCGCGASFKNFLDAQEHADTERHILHVHGTVRPSR